MPSQRQSTSSRSGRGRTLQGQGVPIPDRLRGPRRTQSETTHRRVVQRRTPIDGEMGGTQTETVTMFTRQPQQTSNGVSARVRDSAGNVRQYSPTRTGEKVGGVGLLEAEFIACEFIIFIGLFADTTTAYGDKILSIMKRSLLTGILFFFLALASSAGPNAVKVAKGLGALITVTMLITSPGIISFFDNLAKEPFTATATDSNAASPNDQNVPAGIIAKAESAAGASANAIGSTATGAFETWFLHLPPPAAKAVNKVVGDFLKKIGL
jgi:hypothetical protein